MKTRLFEGPGVDLIRSRYSLTDYVTRGSSAELYRHSPGALWRLSTDAASHNLMVEGSAAKLAFPRVLTDCRSVGISDQTDWDRYWLGAFEECLPIDESAWPAFTAFVNGLRDICDEHGIEARHGLGVHRSFVASNATLLTELELLESLHFVLAFAERNEADLDINLTNFMLSPARHIVITDAVHGCSPDMFL